MSIGSLVKEAPPSWNAKRPTFSMNGQHNVFFLCRLELNICWNLIKNKQYTCWERCLFEAVKQANLICDDLESSNWCPTNFLHWCFGELLSGYSSCWPFAFVCLRCFLCVFVTFYHSKSTGNHHYFSNHPTSKSKFKICVLRIPRSKSEDVLDDGFFFERLMLQRGMTRKANEQGIQRKRGFGANQSMFGYFE